MPFGDNQCMARLWVLLFAPGEYSMKYAYQESNGRWAVVAYWLPTVCGVVHSTCTPPLCGASEVWIFSPNLEAFNKLVTGLAVVFLYGRLYGLIIQDLCPATARFVTKISRPELLGPMPCDAFPHSIIPKGLRHSMTCCGCRQADNSKWIVSKPACFFAVAQTMTDMCTQCNCIGKEQSILPPPDHFPTRDALVSLSVINSSDTMYKTTRIFLLPYICKC